MKFSNTIAYCKGFYEPRGDVDEMWKDMSHCIQVDGWMCYTKKDVARWCMHRFEDFAKEFPKDAWKVSFCRIYEDIQAKKFHSTLYSNIETLEDDDYIIWTFRDFIRYNTDDKHFTEGYIPDEHVLPLVDYVSDYLWENIKAKYTPQDFNNSMFDDFDKREEYINRYEK